LYHLEYQADGNLVLYAPGDVPYWASNTPGASVGYTVMQDDGNFVVYDGTATPIWASGTWGNAGRSTVRAPGLFQIDLALQKRFEMGGSRNFEFRMEAFNAFNRVNLGAPGVAVTSPSSFGRITGPLNRGYGTGTARQMQFMFRVNF